MRSAERFLVPTLLALLVAQCLLSMRLTSATFDEPSYLSAGYAALTTGVDINPAHPPLMKYLLALPLLVVGSAEVEAIPHWRGPLTKPLTFGASFLYENRADPDTMLFAARTAVVAVSLCLGALVWMWSRRLYGPGAALVSLALYVGCPNIIAHSSLATLDLGVSAGIGAALYAVWRMCTRPTLRTGVWAGVALATALLVAGLVAIYSWQQDQRAADVEELDAQLLADDLPIDAYLDRGFETWLKKVSAN